MYLGHAWKLERIMIRADLGSIFSAGMGDSQVSSFAANFVALGITLILEKIRKHTADMILVLESLKSLWVAFCFTESRCEWLRVVE